MTFAIRTATVDMNTKKASFTFDQTVYQYIVGINFVQLAYSADCAEDNAVLQMSLHLDTNLEGNTITVTATPVLRDDSDHNYLPSASAIILSCLAVVGSNDLNASLAHADGIASSGTSVVLPTPMNTDLFVGVLSGFDYSYGTDDHYVREISASTSAGPVAGGAALNGTVQMYDTSGNSATCSVDAAMLAYNGQAASGLLIQTVTYQLNDSDVVVDFGQPITGAGAFLQSWTAVYEGSKDHKLAEWWAGPYGVSVDTSAGKVTLPRPATRLIDDSSNHEDSTNSNVTIVVIATTH